MSIPLRYTPRKILFHPNSPHALVVESTYNTLSVVHDAGVIGEVSGQYEAEMQQHKDPEDMADGGEEEGSDTRQLSEQYARQQRPSAEGAHSWTPCIHFINITQQEACSGLELERGEACFSLTTCAFASRPNALFVVAGCAVGMDPATRKCVSASVHLYYFKEDTGELMLFHKTEVDGVPTALCAFQGMVV